MTDFVWDDLANAIPGQPGSGSDAVVEPLNEMGHEVERLEIDKVDKVEGKNLSTEDYSTNEKEKLAEIESGAEVNVVETISCGNYEFSNINKNIDISKVIPKKETNFTNNQIFSKVFPFTGVGFNEIIADDATKYRLYNINFANLLNSNTTGSSSTYDKPYFKPASGKWVDINSQYTNCVGADLTDLIKLQAGQSVYLTISGNFQRNPNAGSTLVRILSDDESVTDTAVVPSNQTSDYEIEYSLKMEYGKRYYFVYREKEKAFSSVLSQFTNMQIEFGELKSDYIVYSDYTEKTINDMAPDVSFDLAKVILLYDDNNNIVSDGRINYYINTGGVYVANITQNIISKTLNTEV